MAVKENYKPNIKISGTSGNDSIKNDANNVTIIGGKGKDTVYNYGDDVIIKADSGNDSIRARGNNKTIEGGTGNDWIAPNGNNNLILYKAGGGDDTIWAFTVDDTLSISGGSYSTQESGNDLLVKVGKGTIALKDVYAYTDTVHINKKSIALKRKTITAHEDEYITEVTRDSISVVGTVGDNYIDIYGSKVTISAGKGNDFINNEGIDVSINGGAGSDTINSSYGDNATVSGGAGNDSINGGLGLVYVYSSGDDIISNFKFSSTLVLGKQSINSSVHNDENGDVTLNMSGGGKIILQSYWEDIINTVSAVSKATHLNIIHNDKSNTTVTGTNGADFIDNIGQLNKVTIISDAGNDHIQNDGTNISINSGRGNDIIENWGKNVTIIGGDGNDFITNYKESEKSSIDIGSGNDTVYIYSDNTTAIGGAGSEFFWNSYDSENVLMAGGADNDTLINGGSNNSIAGNDGDDYFWNNSGHNNSINGGAGDDSIDGYHFSNSLIGGAGNDFIKVNAGNSNIINGGAGKDTITINAGWKMTVNGGTGNDSISLNSTSTMIKYKSGDGNDTVRGFNSTDTLSITGGSYSTQVSGNDVLVNVGNNTITLKNAKGNAININGKNVGGSSTNSKFIPLTSGNDTITNNQDNVTISGLGGNDFIENDFGDKISVSGGAGNDSIISFHEETWNSETNSPEILSYPEKITINGGKGNDLIDFNAGAKNSLIEYALGDGNDTIYGFDSDDTLKIAGSSYSTKKSGENVIVTIGKGKISLMGAASLSKVIIRGTKATSTSLTVTDSTKSPVTVDSAVKTINASSRTKAVKITGNSLANTIKGGSKNDSLYGGKGNDSILGNTGNDKLYGQSGNDILKGGAGNDSLWGGAGNDSLWGDTGKDTFIYASDEGKDVIYGFENNDLLKITGAFSGTYSKSKGEVYFEVDTTSKAITLSNFSATSFNVNGTNYKISGTKLVKK